MQTTIDRHVNFHGKGLHNGLAANMTIRPAPADNGFMFVRTDVKNREVVIPATVNSVSHTELCTRLSDKNGYTVSTVEHVLAALVSCGIRNARIEVEGSELPVMDGSARDFVCEILNAGVRSLGRRVSVLKILKVVQVSVGDAQAALVPSDFAEMDFEIDFPKPIGRQRQELDLSNGSVVRNLTDCRTFVMKGQIAMIQRKRLGLGGGPENVVIADEKNNRFLCELRRPNEPVGHKMLDAVGDLSLAGYPIVGKFVGRRSGHNCTFALLKKLFATPKAFKIHEADVKTANRLPGVGAALQDVQPV